MLWFLLQMGRRARCPVCQVRVRLDRVMTHLIEEHDGDRVACPLCGAQERGLEGLQEHMGRAHEDRQVTRQIQRCREAHDLSCLAVYPRAWPYGWQGKRDSPVVGRLVATLRENGLEPANPADFAGPLDTTMDSTLDTTMDTTLDETFDHGVVRSVVVVPATTSSPAGGAERPSSPWRSCEPCPVLGEPITCSSPTPPEEEPPAKKKRLERPHLPEEPQDLVTERRVVVAGGPGLEGLVQQLAVLAVLPGATADPQLDGVSLRRRYPGGFHERLPHGLHPDVPPTQRDWTVGEVKLPVIPGGEESLQWPPSGWQAMTPDERLEAHLHVAAILEAGWYGGDTHLSHFCRYAKYGALRLPGSACPRPGDELEKAQAATQSSVRRLERMARRSGRWEEMPACLRLPDEACIAFQLPEPLRALLDVIPQVPHPWEPRR